MDIKNMIKEEIKQQLQNKSILHKLIGKKVIDVKLQTAEIGKMTATFKFDDDSVITFSTNDTTGIK